ncbi:YsnF/AvaK domain-containing protein [Pontibacter rugosus]|uniref:YsnF/AvaK domain-containing protein n=1 Tax=Pontibacter rugosus TaxID=1745966 RepID=A0ABW3SUN8_9BACT
MKMNKSEDKIQTSEFEQKLQESMSGQQRTSHTPDLETSHTSETIPVVEETVEVGKKVVETGRVRISKQVREDEVDVDLPMVHEEIDVKRVPVNTQVETAPPPVRYEGDVMIIPVVREEVVVQKRLVVVEELHVTKKKIQTNETQKVVLRKEEINVDRVNNSDFNSTQA